MVVVVRDRDDTVEAVLAVDIEAVRVVVVVVLAAVVVVVGTVVGAEQAALREVMELRAQPLLWQEGACRIYR